MARTAYEKSRPKILFPYLLKPISFSFLVGLSYFTVKVIFIDIIWELGNLNTGFLPNS